MKINSKDLMTFYHLNNGDTVYVEGNSYKINNCILCNESAPLHGKHITLLEGIEIRKRLKCEDYHCDGCPLRMLHCGDSDFLDEILEELQKLYKDDEIYNIIKRRLENA